MMTPPIRTHRAVPFLAMALMSFSLCAQDFWDRSSFIESDSDYEVAMTLPGADMMTIASTIEPRKRYRKHVGDKIVLSQSYLVYEKAAIGNRAFGKVRYEIHLRKEGDQVLCSFSDFTFSPYERSARYGRMMESREDPKPISTVKDDMNEIQWGLIRYRTSQEIGGQIARIPSESVEGV